MKVIIYFIGFYLMTIGLVGCGERPDKGSPLYPKPIVTSAMR